MRDWAAFQRGDLKHQWFGYETLKEFLLSVGYVEGPGPQLITDDLVGVKPMEECLFLPFIIEALERRREL